MAFIEKAQIDPFITSYFPIPDQSNTGNKDFITRIYFSERMLVKRIENWGNIQAGEFVEQATVVENVQKETSSSIGPLASAVSYLGGQEYLQNSTGITEPYSYSGATLTDGGDGLGGFAKDDGLRISANSLVRYNRPYFNSTLMGPWLGWEGQSYTYRISYQILRSEVETIFTTDPSAFCSFIEFSFESDTDYVYCFGLTDGFKPSINLRKISTQGDTRLTILDEEITGEYIFLEIDIYLNTCSIDFIIWDEDGSVKSIKKFAPFSYVYFPRAVGLTISGADSSISLSNHYPCRGLLRSVGTSIPESSLYRADDDYSPIFELYCPYLGVNSNRLTTWGEKITIYVAQYLSSTSFNSGCYNLIPYFNPEYPNHTGMTLGNVAGFAFPETSSYQYGLNTNNLSVDIEFSISNAVRTKSHNMGIFTLSFTNLGALGLYVDGGYNNLILGQPGTAGRYKSMSLGGSQRGVFQARVIYEVSGSNIYVSCDIIRYNGSSKTTLSASLLFSYTYISSMYGYTLNLGTADSTSTSLFQTGDITYHYIVLGRNSRSSSNFAGMIYQEGMTNAQLQLVYGSTNQGVSSMYNIMKAVNGRYGLTTNSTNQPLTLTPAHTLAGNPTIPISRSTSYRWDTLYTIDLTSTTWSNNSTKFLFGNWGYVTTGYSSSVAYFQFGASYTNTSLTLYLLLGYYTDTGRSHGISIGTISSAYFIEGESFAALYSLQFNRGQVKVVIYDLDNTEIISKDITDDLTYFTVMAVGTTTSYNTLGMFSFNPTIWQGNNNRFTVPTLSYINSIGSGILQSSFIRTSMSDLFSSITDKSYTRAVCCEYSGTPSDSTSINFTMSTNQIRPYAVLLHVRFTPLTSGSVRVFTAHSQLSDDTPRQIQIYGDTSTKQLSIGVMNSSGSTIYNYYSGKFVLNQTTDVTLYIQSNRRVEIVDGVANITTSFSAYTSSVRYAYINGERYYVSGRGRVDYDDMHVFLFA